MGPTPVGKGKGVGLGGGRVWAVKQSQQRPQPALLGIVVLGWPFTDALTGKMLAVGALGEGCDLVPGSSL